MFINFGNKVLLEKKSGSKASLFEKHRRKRKGNAIFPLKRGRGGSFRTENKRSYFCGVPSIDRKHLIESF